MKVKSKEEYFKLQKDLVAAVKKDNIKILVGLGTCGIAAGADKVMDALNKEINDRKLSNVDVVKVGCVGFCYAEPTIEVVYPDGESILLGYLTPETIPYLADIHFTGKKIGDVGSTSKHILTKNIADNVLSGDAK